MNPRLVQWILRIVALPFLLVLLVEVGIGFWLYQRTARFLGDTAQPATGEVVALLEGTGSDGGTTWTPQFTWTDDAGVERTSTTSWSSSPPAFSVGEPIDLLYDPASPEDVRVDGFFSLWLGPVILAAMAAFSAVLVFVLGVALPWAIGRFWTPAAPRHSAK